MTVNRLYRFQIGGPDIAGGQRIISAKQVVAFNQYFFYGFTIYFYVTLFVYFYAWQFAQQVFHTDFRAV